MGDWRTKVMPDFALAEWRGECSSLGEDDEVRMMNFTLAALLNRIAAAESERDRLRAWQDEASANCARRGCSMRDRRLAEAESERDRLREQRDALEAELRWVDERITAVRVSLTKHVFLTPQFTGGLLDAIHNRKGMREALSRAQEPKP